MIYLYLRRVRCLLHSITLSTAQLLRTGPAAAQDRARCPCHAHPVPQLIPPGPTEDKALIAERGDQIQPHWLAEAHNCLVPCPQCQGTAGKGLPLTGPDPARQCGPRAPLPSSSLRGRDHPPASWVSNSPPRPLTPTLPPGCAAACLTTLSLLCELHST